MARRLKLATGGQVGSTTSDKAVTARLERAVARARVLRMHYGSDGSAVAQVGLPIESVRLAVRGSGAVPGSSTSAPTAVVIDARMKPGYPDELFCDPETASRVDRRWKEYFPGGMEMGDSARGHLD